MLNSVPRIKMHYQRGQTVNMCDTAFAYAPRFILFIYFLRGSTYDTRKKTKRTTSSAQVLRKPNPLMFDQSKRPEKSRFRLAKKKKKKITPQLINEIN